MTAALLSWLIAATWKGTLLIAFALVVHRVARNHVPSRWLCALLLVAIARLLTPVAPPSPFSVFNLVRPGEAAPAPVVVVNDGFRRPAPPLLAVRTPAPPPSPRPWIPVALGVWAAGALLFFGRAVFHTVRFRARVAERREVDLGPLLEQCRTALHIRRGVRVAVTNAVATPSLHGWLRPMLLLPEGFLESFPREQVRYAVLHELAHLRRSDVLINWLATAAAALHWFNPFVRLAVARLAEERELACDALALSALRADERPAYGGAVLAIVDQLRATQRVPALVGMTATPQQLKRRIVMIASFKQPRYSILFAVALFAVGFVTLTDARAHEQKRMEFKRVLSGEAGAIIERLDTKIGVDVRSASVQDAVLAIANSAGITVTFAEGAVDAATRVSVKGENIAAHLALMETLSSVGLGVKFTDTGIEVIKEDALHIRTGDGERVMIMRKHGDADHPIEATDGERVIIRRKHADADQATLEGKTAVRKRVEVQATAEKTADGTTRTKFTVSSDDGSPAGTLEIEVTK